MTVSQSEVKNYVDTDPQETQEWIEALDNVIDHHGSERTAYLIDQQIAHARTNGVLQALHTETPYINTMAWISSRRCPVIKRSSTASVHSCDGMRWRWF